MQPYGPAVLRLAVGAVFVAHGAQKLLSAAGGGLPETASAFADLGLTPVWPVALLIGLVELAGGLLLICGALTRWVSPVLALATAVAVWKIHLPNGFFMNWSLAPGQGHGYEFSLALIAALVSLMLTGPGALSVDGRRARTAEAAAYGRARLRAGRV